MHGIAGVSSLFAILLCTGSAENHVKDDLNSGKASTYQTENLRSGYIEPSLIPADEGQNHGISQGSATDQAQNLASALDSQAIANSQGLVPSYDEIKNNKYDIEGTSTKASAVGVAVANAESRLVPINDYILPDLAPGGENIVHCTREGELHYLQSPNIQCAVCACIRDNALLRAVCASCQGCSMIMEPITVASSPPRPPPPVPTPESPASCDPLPTNMPFQNPLNPCQVCLCRQVIDFTGNTEAQIVCEEDPQCVLAPDTVIIPPMRIPTTPLPYIPASVTEVPVITPADPIPWPPVHPSPLPGPPPHASCHPYPPNRPFQHPWDDCQVCVCIEAISVGITNVEVNCYTKKECCIEPPLTLPPPTPAQAPQIHSYPTAGSSSEAHLSTTSQANSLVSGSQSTHHTLPIQSPNKPVGPILQNYAISESVADAFNTGGQSSAIVEPNSLSNGRESLTNSFANMHTSSFNPYHTFNSGLSQANTNGDPYYHLPGSLNPGNIFLPSQNAQASSNAAALMNSGSTDGLNPYLVGYTSGFPDNNHLLSGSSQASANSNAISYATKNLDTRPHFFRQNSYGVLGSPQASVNAMANAAGSNSGSNIFSPSYKPSHNLLQPMVAQGLTNTNALASIGNYYPFKSGNPDDSTEFQASANSIDEKNLPPNTNAYPYNPSS